VSADVSLTTRVSIEEGIRASADTSLTTRVSAEESLLQQHIDTTETADASLTTRISAEESARASADASLTTRVSADSSSRVTGDASLTTRISAEESTSAAAAGSLSTRISTETSARVAALLEHEALALPHGASAVGMAGLVGTVVTLTDAAESISATAQVCVLANPLTARRTKTLPTTGLTAGQVMVFVLGAGTTTPDTGILIQPINQVFFGPGRFELTWDGTQWLSGNSPGLTGTLASGAEARMRAYIATSGAWSCSPTHSTSWGSVQGATTGTATIANGNPAVLELRSGTTALSTVNARFAVGAEVLFPDCTTGVWNIAWSKPWIFATRLAGQGTVTSTGLWRLKIGQENVAKYGELSEQGVMFEVRGASPRECRLSCHNGTTLVSTAWVSLPGGFAGNGWAQMPVAITCFSGTARLYLGADALALRTPFLVLAGAPTVDANGWTSPAIACDLTNGANAAQHRMDITYSRWMSFQ
jgi:hypothetical protein